MPQKIKLNIENEYDRLKKVIMADGANMVEEKFSPKFLEKYGSGMAGEIKFHPETAPVNVKKARTAHREFINLLKSRGVEIFFVKNIKDATDQVFTRDPGFVIGDVFFTALMGDPIRAIEQKGFESFEFEKEKELEGVGAVLEGGDVLTAGKKIYVGITAHSTDWRGFKILKKELPDRECVPVRCAENVLHLDCRFNILGPGLALAGEDDIFEKDLAKLKKDFEIIPLRPNETETYAANVFLISPREVVLDARNRRVEKILKSYGFEIYMIDYSELTKMWGAFRCTTLPLQRE